MVWNLGELIQPGSLTGLRYLGMREIGRGERAWVSLGFPIDMLKTIFLC